MLLKESIPEITTIAKVSNKSCSLWENGGQKVEINRSIFTTIA